MFITRHSVITLQGGRVFTAAALTHSSSVEMYIQAEPGRAEPACVWRSSERIVAEEIRNSETKMEMKPEAETHSHTPHFSC